MTPLHQSGTVLHLEILALLKRIVQNNFGSPGKYKFQNSCFSSTILVSFTIQTSQKNTVHDASDEWNLQIQDSSSKSLEFCDKNLR